MTVENARPYVARIESNVKGGVGEDLSRRVLVVGKNGSGKSKLVNAVELALVGRAGDIAGRDEVAREAELLSLAPGRSGKLFAMARLSDGTTCEWACSGTTESAKKAKPARYKAQPAVLPLRGVSEVLRSSPATAREFFLRRLADADDARVLAHIPAPLQTLYGQASGAAPTGASPVARLLCARESATTGAREANARAKAAREAAANVGAGLAPPPTEDELRNARDKVALATTFVERAARAAGQASIRAQIGQARAALPSLEAQLSAAKAQLAAAPAPAGLSPLYHTCIVALDALAEARSPRCLVCGRDDDAARLVKRAADIEAQISRWRVAESAHVVAKNRTQQAENALAFARANIARLEACIDPSLADAPAQDAARVAHDAAAATLRSLEENRAAWAVAQKAAAPAQGTGSDAALWKALAKACDEAIEAILDRAVEDFRARVQQYLPAGDSFALRLRDGTREVFQAGFARVVDGTTVVHTALSGAEWARMTAALAAALAEPDGPCVIIPEERAFDPDTLADVCDALGRAANGLGAQVVLTSPVEPARIPEGWQIVRTGTPAASPLDGQLDVAALA